MEGHCRVLLLLSLTVFAAASTVRAHTKEVERSASFTASASCPIAAIPPNCHQPKDCAEVLQLGYSKSGVYTVYVGPLGEPIKVYCDQGTDGGGWLVFQRRRDGFENFYRNWKDYSSGFGELYGEFWLGNHFLNLITRQKSYKLRVDLEDFDGDSALAEYTTFSVDSAHLQYPLTVGGYSGTAGDSLRPHNGMKFSTYNKDNDLASKNCASTFSGAWWYRACHNSNLNGKYLGGPHTSNANGINWRSWHGYFYSLKTTEMKIKPN